MKFIANFGWGVIGVFLIIVGLFGGAGDGEASLPANASLDRFQTEHEEPSEAAERGAKWLITQHQNDDGGYTSFSAGANQGPSDVSGTIDAIIALGKARVGVGATLSYLESHVEDMVSFAGQDGSAAGKTIIALTSAGANPYDFGGENFVEVLVNHLSSDGHYSVANPFGQSLAILGISAAGEEIPTTALDWLSDQRDVDGELSGSWDDGFGTAGNADTTAMALLAFAAADYKVDDTVVAEGLEFLESVQLNSAGWEYGPGFGENANSTALVLQTLVAYGQDVSTSEASWSVDGRSPLAALLSWQSDSGAFQADFGEGRSDDFFSTVQSTAALADVAGALESGATESIAGGDSALPYWLLGALVIVLTVTAYLMFWRRR